MVEKFDLHERHRRVQELDPYEHLQRLLRLCTSHAHRNIQKCSVSEAVRNKMRSLICMEHPNWDQTIAEIQKEGGKAGQGKKKKLKHFEVQWAHMIHDRLAT